MELLTPAQCRMARSALRWTAQDLAQRSHVSRTTVARFEVEQVEPNPATLIVLRQALEAASVEFLPGGAVRLREQPAEAS
jgi:transcriptional regulator with XRE-family HTH domain